MAMNFSVAQFRITREIREAEAALDAALVRHSELFTTLVSSRGELGVNAFLGQEALLRLTKSQSSLMAASNDLARVHGHLRDIVREVTGDVLDGDCAPASQAPLKAVA